MHLTVTQWRSLVPMAPKSEVSGMAESVPLETGKKKKNQIYVLYACRYIFHHQELQRCSVVTLLQDHFSRFVKHMNIKKEKALKKANSNCSESVVLKVSSVVSQEFLWNTRNLFVNGNSTLHSKSISFYIFDNVHLLKQLKTQPWLQTKSSLLQQCSMEASDV